MGKKKMFNSAETRYIDLNISVPWRIFAMMAKRSGTVGCQCTKSYEYYEDLEVWIRRILELWNAIVDYMIWFSKQTFAFGSLLEHGVNKPNCYLAPELEEWEEYSCIIEGDFGCLW